MADQTAINAIELAGSQITLAYYDIISKRALVDPVNYFLKGRPIDKRMLPTVSDQKSDKLYTYYSDPVKRGYLADPEQVEIARKQLYEDHGKVYDKDEFHKNFKMDPKSIKKHPRQIFYGLEAGMLVNIKDKVIYEPVTEEVEEFYRDEFRYGGEAKGFVKENGYDQNLSAQKKNEGKIHYTGEDTRKSLTQEEFQQWMSEGKLKPETKEKYRKKIK